MRRALALLVLAIVAGTAAAAADAPCPASGAARLGRSAREMESLATASTASADGTCALRGLALADWLDREGLAACRAADRLDAGDVAGDVDLLAFRSALSWRCGRPRSAYDDARAALALDDTTTLAWRVLGEVLEARFLDRSALAAYRRALARDPAEVRALAGVARVTPDREERRRTLELYLAAGPGRGEPEQNLRSARETLEFMDALGDRQLWVLEKADLPGELRLEPLVIGPGRVRGWVARLDLGPETKVPVLIDSGASGLHLDPRLAPKSGLTALSEGTLVGGGGAGEHAVSRGTVPRVVIGPMTYRSALGVVAAGSLDEIGAFRALIGLDVLGGTVVRFLPWKQRLVIEEADALTQPDDPLQADPWPAGAGVVPLFSVDGQLLVPVTFRAGEAAVSVLALLDTGASGTLLDEAAADSLGEYRKAGLGGARGYGGAIGLAGIFRSATVDVGAIHEMLRDVRVTDLSIRGRLAGVHVGAYVGEDVWGRNGFEIDLASGVFRPIPR